MHEASMPLTPDFYDYEWVPLASVVLDGVWVRVCWGDGTELNCFDQWLYESAVGLGTDLATREGIVDPGLVDGSVRIVEAAASSDGGLDVQWSTGGASSYHPGWLHHVAMGQHLPSAWLPETVVWTPNELSEPPTYDGSTILDDENQLLAYLADMVRYGLARLRNLPDDHDFGYAFAERLGGLRRTNFGDVWDVKAKVHSGGDAATNSTANTSLRLGPHTDLPTREIPPGFQFLHCVANEVAGGHSTMADGAAVVEHLRVHHPDHYQALTTLRWVFFNRGVGIDHRWSGPLIDHGVDGAALTLRAFYPVRAFPDMDPADMPRAYGAMAVFYRLADSDEFQLRYPFSAGDMIGFDNRRILHGRLAYESGGSRHLRGFYVDHDEVYSTTRVLQRRLAAQERS